MFPPPHTHPIYQTVVVRVPTPPVLILPFPLFYLQSPLSGAPGPCFPFSLFFFFFCPSCLELDLVRKPLKAHPNLLLSGQDSCSLCPSAIGHFFPGFPAFLRSSSPVGRVSQEGEGRRQLSQTRQDGSEGMGEKAAVFWRWGTGEERAAPLQSRAEQRGCRGGSGGSVIRAEIDAKGRHRRQRESIKREDHIRSDRESFKLQGCCHHRGGVGGWKEGALEPREGGEF